jgi:hypothetical protein
MPFRKALSRDSWEPSVRGEKIAEQWDLVRRGGGKTSFDKSDA